MAAAPVTMPEKPGAIGFEATQLDMTSLGSLRKGGTSSRSNIIVPGRPDQSILVQKLEGTAIGGRMPFGARRVVASGYCKSAYWILEGAVGSDSE